MTPLRAAVGNRDSRALFDNWLAPVGTGLRDRAREFLQAMFEAELDEALARSRYALVTGCQTLATKPSTNRLILLTILPQWATAAC
jgi:hypothetical protein